MGYSSLQHIYFAKEAHGDQRYGSHPYEYHLAIVERILADFGYTSIEWSQSAWLHDVIEDTKVTYFQVQEKFGTIVADRVWAVTGIGKNRADRVFSILVKISANRDGAILKCADRIANVEQSVLEDNRKTFQMYLGENAAFLKALGNQVPEEMINRLKNAFVEGVKKGLD